MDSWWIDETPYPGPDETNPWAAVIRYFGKQFGKAASVAAEAIGELGIEINKAGEKLSQLGLVLWTPPPSFYDEMSYMERREYALRLQQNRNTGPQSRFGYSRNGKKVI